ncbi:hypothetical protein RUND412_003103 [Rhizina undulata]
MLCHLLRLQSTMHLNVICGRYATSQSVSICTRRLGGCSFSSTRIRIFPKQQSRSRKHSSSSHADSLPPVSVEQKLAIDKLIAGSGNVVINAYPGSGKTTTILQVAAAGNKKILALMFNRLIMDETMSRASNLGIENMVAYTYHSFGYEFYSPECSTDHGLKRVLEDRMPPRKALPECNILVLDEQQDMNPILYEFAHKIIGDLTRKDSLPQLLLLGDPRQEIYGFNNADKRFLTLAEDLFPRSCGSGMKTIETDWTEISQRNSYRMTKQTAGFINKQVLKPSEGEEILTVKNDENPKPRYLICGRLSQGPLQEILRLIDLGVPPSQIMVLAPSLRSRNASVRDLANQLALNYPSIRIHISNNDYEISPRVSQGKIIFATYHQAKGIEREAVIVFGFDASYHIFFRGNPAESQSVANPQYVAVTRAKTHLTVIHDCEYEYLPFVNQETLHESCEVVQLQDITPKETELPKRGAYGVVSLTRNISELATSDCFAMLDLNPIARIYSLKDWPVTEIEVQKDVWESVAEITGTAILAIYELQIRGTCSSTFSDIFQRLQKKPLQGHMKLLPPQHIERLHQLALKNTAGTLEIADILYLANVSDAIRSGYIVKVLVIPFEKYTWFTAVHAKKVFRTLKKYIPATASYEKQMARKMDDVPVDGECTSVFGQADFSTYGRVWEVKWARILRPEHVIQTVLYSVINEPKSTAAQIEGIKSSRPDLLINIPMNQIIEVRPKYLGGRNAFKEVLRRTVIAKSEERGIQLNDEGFLKEAAGGFKNFIGKVTVPAWLNAVTKFKTKK